MKIVLAPDSFKGTLSARKVCEIEEKVIRESFPDADIVSIPMADGGEGLVDSYLNILGGEKVSLSVTGPDGRPVDASYAFLPSGIAVIEMAQAAGLPLIKEKNPLSATTRGVGELLLDAKAKGAEKVILGLGGSATNDCGIGMAEALGFVFADKNDEITEALARNLKKIERISFPEDKYGIRIEASCDVDNPLLGPEGATYTFGPQKGAGEKELKILEEGMTHFREVLERDSKVSVDVPGAGAAGGMGASVLALLGGELRPGAEILLDAAAFDELISDADYVITGEGRIDCQSVHGKVPSAVAGRCRKMGIPCIVIAGCKGPGAEKLNDLGISKIYAGEERTMEEVLLSCREDLEKLTHEFLEDAI